VGSGFPDSYRSRGCCISKSALAGSQRTQTSAGEQQRAEHQAGNISGTVVDQSGANVAGAVVKLTREGQSSGLEVTTDEDGLFAFSNVAPGSFHLTISSPNLASQEFSGTLQSGEAYVTPLIMLVISTQVTEVHVEGLTPEELADVQIKEQEKAARVRGSPELLRQLRTECRSSHGETQVWACVEIG
jgi:hypothetical protein